MSNPVLDFNLGAYIQIAYSKGVRNQISEDFRDFEYVKRQKVGNPEGRELKFMFKEGNGPAANQFSRITNYAFARGQQISVREYTAEYQHWDCTVEFDYNLWDLARKNPATYGDFLAEELSSKILEQKKLFAQKLYGDGTDAVFEADAAADDTNIATGVVTVVAENDNAAIGHIGFVQYDDILAFASTTGTVRVPTGLTAGFGAGQFYGFRVKDKVRSSRLVTLEIIDSFGTVLTAATASNIAINDIAYRMGVPATVTAARLDRTASGLDYGKQLAIPGLASLASNDGRIVHGITMSGRTGSTVEDGGAAALSNTMIENLLNNMKIRVGESAYSWKMMATSPEGHSKFILDREANRRFMTQDTTEGGKKFTYQHRNDMLEIYATEYCPQNRLYVLPEAKNGNKVLELHASDYETVKVNDSSAFHLNVADGAYTKKIVTYMTGKGTLINKHPAAIGVLTNFTL